MPKMCFRICSLTLITVFLLFPSVGCNDPDSREWARQGRPIINGVADTSAAHMATVAITKGSGTGYFCSGTLISPNVVMTAAHCLEDYWGNPEDPTDFEVFFGNDAYGSGTYRGVSEGVQHPNWNRNSLDGDLALLRLSSTAPSQVIPIPHLPSALELTQADEGTTSVDFSGFGLDESGRDGDKLHVSNIIDTVCDSANGCDGGNVVQYGMGYDQTPGGPCSGDSGGPAYVMRSGTEYVAGVTSYGDQNCSYFGVSTMADRYSGWIDNFIGGSVSENCTNDLDDDDDQLTDCDDPDCAAHPDCLGPSACTQAATIACSDQMSGTTVGGAMNFTGYSCLQGSEDGPEVAYKVDAPAGTPVSVTMQPVAGGDLDLFLLEGTDSDCDPGACLDGSVEEGTAAEHVSFTMGSGDVYLVVETWDTPTTFTLSLSCGQSEICDNNTDDDGDQLEDCDDPDCASHPNCTGTTACTLAETISCGEQATANTANGLTEYTSYSCLGGYNWNGPELAFFVDAPVGADVVAQMTHGGANSDLDMFLLPASGGTCDPTACIDASYEEQPPEIITFTMPSGGAYLVVDTWEGPTSFGLSLTCSGTGENCTNYKDDDDDQLVDCDDPDCFNHPACEPQEEICDNDQDDDGDQLVDCDDPGCDDHPDCQGVENCINGVDDDGDQLADCDDPDCANYPTCLTEGNCDNDQDDDGDQLTDCDDPDCANDPDCQTQDEICDNGQDDDGDQLSDCDDPDCANDPACQATDEICDNEQDDDGDQLADCDDPDCANDPACQAPSEICDNNQDDDGDQLVDCDDPECSQHQNCLTSENCTNGSDEDGDNLIDCADPDCNADPACSEDSGCGCAAAGTEQKGAALLLLLGLVWLGRRRGSGKRL